MWKNNNYTVGHEYKHFLILRIINIIIFGMVLTAFGFLVFFIYQRVFQSMDRTQALVTKNSDIGIVSIDFETFNRVEKKWKDKYGIGVPEIERDPFNVPTPTASATSSATSTPLEDHNSEQN